MIEQGYQYKFLKDERIKSVVNSTRREKLDRKINSIISLGDTKTAV